MAQAAGEDAAGMTSELNIFQQKLQSGVFGRDTLGFAAFKQLGIDIGNKDYVARADKVLDDVMSRLKGKTSGQQQIILGTLGLQSFAPLLLNYGKYSESIKKWGSETAESIAMAMRFRDSLNDSEVGISRLGQTIGRDLIPAFQPILTGMNNWLATNREFMASEISGFITNVGKAAIEVGGAFEGVGEKLKLWKNDADAVVKVIEVSMVLAIGKVSAALMAMAARFAATPLGLAIIGGMAGYKMVEQMPEGAKNFLAAPMTAAGNAGIGLYNITTGKNLPYQKYGDMLPDNNMEFSDYLAAMRDQKKTVYPSFPYQTGIDQSGRGAPVAQDLMSPLLGPYGKTVDNSDSEPGKVKVEVIFHNAPKGTRTITQTSGDIDAATNVLHTMPPNN